MKKVLIFLGLAVLAFGALAQDVKLMPLVLGDTITNTGTVTKTLPAITSGFSGTVVDALLTKISGTGAGTAQLQISNNGTTFFNSGSAYTITNVAAQSAIFSIAAPVPKYVRILFTGSGTESVQVRIYYRNPIYQHF